MLRHACLATGLKMISSQPPIYVVEGFLADEECAALIQTAGPLLQRSKTHAAAGSEATKGRTSLTCHLCPPFTVQVGDRCVECPRNTILGSTGICSLLLATQRRSPVCS